MMEYIQIISAFVGGINLLFLFKLIFSDIKDLRDKIDQHLLWHLESPKYHAKRSVLLKDDE